MSTICEALILKAAQNDKKPSLFERRLLDLRSLSANLVNG